MKGDERDIKRAAEMLRIAAKYIRDEGPRIPEAIIFYDEAECDGYCVAGDCEIAADCLGIVDDAEEISASSPGAMADFLGRE